MHPRSFKQAFHAANEIKNKILALKALYYLHLLTEGGTHKYFTIKLKLWIVTNA